MKRWRAILGVTIAVVVCIATFSKKQPAPQIITLPNGEQYEFVTAEWGTSLVQPTFLARTVAHLPGPIRDFIVKKWGNQLGIGTVGISSILSGRAIGMPGPPQPVLRFWFRCIHEIPGGAQNNFKMILADKNGVISGHGSGGWGTCGQGKNKWLDFSFPVMPRRDETLQLVVFQAADATYGPFSQIAAVQVPNPLFHKYPNWKPEALPATKMAGDLRVTLSDVFVASQYPHGETTFVNGKQTQFHPPGPGEDRTFGFKLDIDSPRGPNEVWLIGAAELSDATGNQVRANDVARWPPELNYVFGPALWLDESAWQLNLHLKKSRGSSAPDELVTFTNVPVPVVGSATTIYQTNIISGVPVILKQEFVREPDRKPIVIRPPDSSTHLVLELVNRPKDFVVDFIEVKGDTGWKPTEWSGWNSSAPPVIYLFSIPPNVSRLNVTWAVQKQRNVGFLVKPPSAK